MTPKVPNIPREVQLFEGVADKHISAYKATGTTPSQHAGLQEKRTRHRFPEGLTDCTRILESIGSAKTLAGIGGWKWRGSPFQCRAEPRACLPVFIDFDVAGISQFPQVMVPREGNNKPSKLWQRSSSIRGCFENQGCSLSSTRVPIKSESSI